MTRFLDWLLGCSRKQVARRMERERQAMRANALSLQKRRGQTGG